MIDGVMYSTGNFGRVYALDAASGKELWTYDPQIDGQWARYACCDAVNRGLVAFHGCFMSARSTAGCTRSTPAPAGASGRSIPSSPAPEKALHRHRGAAPRGGSRGHRQRRRGLCGRAGLCERLRPESGALRWRFFTVPRDPAGSARSAASRCGGEELGSAASLAGGAAAAPPGTAWPTIRRSGSFISAQAMPLRITRTWVDGAAGMSFTPPPSSRSMRATGRSPGTTRPHRAIAGISTAPKNLVLADLEIGGRRRPGAHAGSQERLLLCARSCHGRAALREALRLRELGPGHRSDDRTPAARCERRLRSRAGARFSERGRRAQLAAHGLRPGARVTFFR